MRRFSGGATPNATATTEGAKGVWRKTRLQLEKWARVPSASSVAGAVALVPIAGGAWLVTVYALRQRLCEHHLQQVLRLPYFEMTLLCVELL